MKKLLFIVAILIFSSSSATFSQNYENPEKLTSLDRDMLKDADYLMSEGNFIRALPLFLVLNEAYPNILDIKYKLGICYLYKTDQLDNGISILDSVYKINPRYKDIKFYLANAYRMNYEFDVAADLYRAYLNETPSDINKSKAKHFLEQCESAKAITQVPINVEIRNLGSPINTEFSEYVPIISADESMLIFTYRGERSKGGLQSPTFNPDPEGEYYEDVFISYKVGDSWTNPEGIGENINTIQHDAAIALSADGQKLFIYKSDKKNGGDIYMSSLDGEVWSVPQRLNENINTTYWEGSCSMSGDEQTLYFSSDRSGGLGGKDIYKSSKQSDGTWGKSVNLGPVINTLLNEDAPFIHSDGVSFYFSSEGHNSLGGYDIFYTYQTDTSWALPVNFGYPANTTGDDIYYVLSANGEKGYYSSGAPGGKGEQDIYTITTKVSRIKPVLALLKGILMANDKPLGAKILVSNAETGKKIGSFNANSSTGKYLLALPPGRNYKIDFKSEGRPDLTQYLNLKTLDNYVEVNKDLKLDANVQQPGQPAESDDVLQKAVVAKITKGKAENAVKETAVYQEILKKHGDVRSDSIEYHVQLVAYKDESVMPAIQEAEGISIKEIKGEDGITRITGGPFKTLIEAEAYKSKMLNQDSLFKYSAIKIQEGKESKSIPEYFASEFQKENLLVKDVKEIILTQSGFVTEQVQPIAAVSPDSKAEQVTIEDRTETKAQESERAITQKTDTVKTDETVKETKLQVKEQQAAEEVKEQTETTTLAKQDEEKKAEKLEIKEKERSAETYACDEMPFYDFVANFDGKDLNIPAVYNSLVEKAGEICAGGLIYTVQIGAYRHPENFKYPHLSEWTPAVIKDFPDGITRFTMKEFKTLKEAETFRQKVIKKGTKDAWITAIYKGERKLLQDLILVNFFNRRIG